MTHLLSKDTAPVSAGEDDLRQYLREIHQYPLLTADEEKELALRCAAGNAEAIRHMVNSNLRLVVSVAREYAGRGVPLMDLIQEGSIGLLAAAERFDPGLEFRFSTYATKWIRQGVGRCLMHHALIRVPGHTAEKLRRIQQAKRELIQELGAEPTLEQIAEKCAMSKEKVQQLLQLVPQVCSLDAPAGEGEDGALGILLEDLQAPQPYEMLVKEELDHTINTLLSALTPRQQQVLRLHFGMNDNQCHSLEEIGNILGISKERARQIERQAMDKLQKMGASMGLEDFLE